MAMTGASWLVQAAKGASGQELKQVIASSSGIPAQEIQLMREIDGALVGDSEEAVGESHTGVFMVRVRKLGVLVTFEIVRGYASLFETAFRRQWIEDPENTKWDDVAMKIVKERGSPVVFLFPAVHFRCAKMRHVAVKQCFIASLVKGEVTDETLEQDRLRWKRFEDEDRQRAKDALFQCRLAAVQNGKRPCGVGWCNCLDFDGSFDGSDRVCRCMHSAFEHMGEKFGNHSRAVG
jgi:hypothetical protein